jgi:hypothetical protein
LSQYASFEKYLEGKYYNDIHRAISGLILKRGRNNSFYSYTVLDPSYFQVDDIHVKTVSFHSTDGNRIIFNAAVEADVILKGMGKRDYDADMNNPWYAVSFTGYLSDGLNMVIQPCTFSEPIKVLRVRYYAQADSGSWQRIYVYALHIYGVKASGELPEDIIFLDDDTSGDPEFIRDMDWGDRQEGTTIMKRIKLFNSSTTKIAHNLSLSLIDTDLLFSMDEGITWITGATITSLAPQGTSASIIVKNTIPPPTQLLGPRAPRFEVTIGSWS